MCLISDKRFVLENQFLFNLDAITDENIYLLSAKEVGG